MPVDPPDTEFDCICINGEGSYYTAVVGGVRNVLDYVYLYCTAQPNVPERASCESFSFKLRWSTNTACLSSLLIIHLIRFHTSSSCKSS